MSLTLRPKIEHLIDDQLKMGRFSTREQLIEAAIIEVCHDDSNEIDNDISAAIDEGRAQCDRGEGIPFEARSWKDKPPRRHGSLSTNRS